VTPPRSVIRGENPGVAVSIDWLAFTYTPRTEKWIPELRSLLEQHVGLVGWEPRRGWQGYEQSARIEGALVAWGGSSQRASVHVELPGSSLGGVRDWGRLAGALERLSVRVTRVDVAGDDYFGERLSIGGAIADYRSGGFTAEHGRRPVARVIDDIGNDTGKTVYVGNRANGKLARIYEKGKQLGDKASKWIRAEVEWRAKDRVLPLALLLEPARFLAGSYPAFAWFSEVATRVRTVKQRAVISYQRVVAIARMQAGRAINAMLHVTGGDIGAVVSSLRRAGLPARLSTVDVCALTGAGG